MCRRAPKGARRRAAGGIVLVLVSSVLGAGCGTKTTDGEERACAASDALFRADRSDTAEQTTALQEAAASSGNDALVSAGRSLKRAVEQGDRPEVLKAIQQVNAECDRLDLLPELIRRDED